MNNESEWEPESQVRTKMSPEERCQRMQREFNGYRQRERAERARHAEAGRRDALREFLPVIDNLERALDIDEGEGQERLRAGVSMTLAQARQALLNQGVEVEECLGQPFDPRRHEAVGMVADPNRPDQQIIEVLQTGYRMQDEAFRPARVVVNVLD